MLFLPERRLGFEIIHEKARGGKSLVAVTARRHHEHDRLARTDQPKTVDGGNALKRPAGGGLTSNAADFLFRHSGIMLDFERRERAALVAAKAHKGDKRADIG